VLAVAGAVREQPPWELFVGLGFSVILTGVAAAGVARVLHRLPWIGHIGLIVAVVVAGRVALDGAPRLRLPGLRRDAADPLPPARRSAPPLSLCERCFEGRVCLPPLPAGEGGARAAESGVGG